MIHLFDNRSTGSSFYRRLFATTTFCHSWSSSRVLYRTSLYCVDQGHGGDRWSTNMLVSKQIFSHLGSRLSSMCDVASSASSSFLMPCSHFSYSQILLCLGAELLLCLLGSGGSKTLSEPLVATFIRNKTQKHLQTQRVSMSCKRITLAFRRGTAVSGAQAPGARRGPCFPCCCPALQSTARSSNVDQMSCLGWVVPEGETLGVNARDFWGRKNRAPTQMRYTIGQKMSRKT